MRALFGELEPIRPEYRDRDARIAVMDRQGLDGCLLFPTLGVGMEESLAADPPALVAAFGAFNRWLEDDWGYAYQERIFAAPMLTLVDVDAAVDELQRVLDADARVVCIKGGPVHTPTGLTSPADARFDPFWGLVNESGVTVGIHSGDAGYGRYVSDWEPASDFEAFRHSPLRMVLQADRPPYETMAALVCQGLFDRFPRIRVASIEAGASWVPILLKKLRKAYGQMPGGVRLRSGRDLPLPRMGGAVLRGRPGRPEGRARARPPALRLGLAARRGPGRTADVRRRPAALRLQRARDPHGHGRERLALTRRV